MVTRTSCLFASLFIFSACTWCSLLVLDMQSRGVWCQRTPEQLSNQCDALVAFVQALNQQNITNWLCYGSALAVIRAESLGTLAAPIPWESDDDVCVYEKDTTHIENVLSQLSQQKLLRTEVLVGNVVRYRIERVDRLAGPEWGIDVYAHREKMFYGTQKMIQNVAANRDRTHRDVPYSMLQPLSTKHGYCGSNIFAIPHQSIPYVSHLFGTTWKIPLASFTGSNGYRRFTCFFSSLFGRQNVPNLRVVRGAGKRHTET